MATQHADYHRKIGLRQQLLTAAGTLAGAVYAPFCGDGDLTVDCYAPRSTLRPVYGADLDPARVATCSTRLAELEIPATIRVADCDGWPFPDLDVEPLAIVDLDAYAYPYHAWRSVIENAELTERAVVLFTDGERLAISRAGHWINPDGSKGSARKPDNSIDLAISRPAFNFYWTKSITPWWRDQLAEHGLRQVKEQHYLRGMQMLYWGAVIERVPVTATQQPEAPTAAPGAEKSAAPESPQEPEQALYGPPSPPTSDALVVVPDAPDEMVSAAEALEEMRGYKFDRLKREQYLDLLREGGRRGTSAREVGVAPRTIRRWQVADPAFADEVSQAEMEAHEHVEDALFQAASSGNTTAMIFYLTNRSPEVWQDRRGPSKVILNGDEHGGPVRLDLDLAELRERVMAGMEELQAKAAGTPVIDVDALDELEPGDDNAPE